MIGKWLEVFIDQEGDTGDFNDSNEVNGYLTAYLDDDELVIECQRYDKNGKMCFNEIEYYKVVQVDPDTGQEID